MVVSLYLIMDHSQNKRLIQFSQFIMDEKTIFENTHESDITYHIDFEYIKKVAKKFNLYFYGPISQKKFFIF